MGGGTVAEHFSKWIFPSSCFSQNAVVVVAAAVVVALVALLQLVLKLVAQVSASELVRVDDGISKVNRFNFAPNLLCKRE